ncbi:MAG: hypothetical protein ACLU37_02505 [Collinsella sp.]
MAVDKAGKHPAARGILDGIALGRLNRRGDPHDLIALHGKIGAAKSLGVTSAPFLMMIMLLLID